MTLFSNWEDQLKVTNEYNNQKFSHSFLCPIVCECLENVQIEYVKLSSNITSLKTRYIYTLLHFWFFIFMSLRKKYLLGRYHLILILNVLLLSGQISCPLFWWARLNAWKCMNQNCTKYTKNSKFTLSLGLLKDSSNSIPYQKKDYQICQFHWSQRDYLIMLLLNKKCYNNFFKKMCIKR